MNTRMTVSLALLVVLVSAGPVPAHHSLVNFDTTQAVRVRGTVFQFHPINPHSFIYLDEKRANGQTRRWAVEGPSLRQLQRRGVAGDLLKPGDQIEVCGYAPKEAVIWQMPSTDPSGVSPAGRLLNAELLIMPDGTERDWGGYGVNKCYPPGNRDRQSK